MPDFRNADGSDKVVATGFETSPGVALSGITVSTTATKAELDALHSQGAVAADFAKLHAATGAAIASGTQHAHIANIGNTATGTEIATAVNAILVALEAFAVNASA